MSLTIIADENIPAVEEFFGALGTVHRVAGRQIQASHLETADVLLVRSVTEVDEVLLRDSPVRFVGTATSGLEHIDREYLDNRGIAFSAAAGANANSVVEYVLCAIAETDDYLERLLDGGALGVVGYGAIGRLLVQRCEALGMAYRVSDPWLDQSTIPRATDLSGILRCDVISLHPELTRQAPYPSFHLLDREQLAQIGAGQLLINASRGAVVNNAALANRLAEADAPLATLDVWESEPVLDADLAGRVRFATAHIAGYSFDAKLQATLMLRDALVNHLRLEPEGDESAPLERPITTLPEHRTSAELIRGLLKAQYDIALDDTLLRASLREDNPGAAFDRLRKDYRIRRELAGTCVSGRSVSTQQQSILTALGCQWVKAV